MKGGSFRAIESSDSPSLPRRSRVTTSIALSSTCSRPWAEVLHLLDHAAGRRLDEGRADLVGLARLQDPRHDECAHAGPSAHVPPDTSSIRVSGSSRIIRSVFWTCAASKTLT